MGSSRANTPEVSGSTVMAMRNALGDHGAKPALPKPPVNLPMVGLSTKPLAHGDNSKGSNAPELAKSPMLPTKPPGDKKAQTSGLASRRNNFLNLSNVKTNIEDKEKMGRRRRRTIQKVDDALQFYDLGRQVMPSCHRGMEVIFAKHKASGTDVVIKIRHKGQSFHDSASEREWRESTEFVLNLPSSSAIAQVFEVLEDNRAFWVVMEKVTGQDLFEQMSGSGLLPMAEVKEVMRQLLTALKELHDRGAIHKDLKLENVMFSRVKEQDPASPVAVKLIDFDTVEECKEPASPKRAKDVLGTDQYIAQEAYDGLYSPASDIFAAGVIGFRICTGKFPFPRDMFNDEAGENWVGSPKMKEIRQKLCKYKIDWSHRTWAKEPQAKNLIRWMLSVSEQQRPSAGEALQHPWLTNAGCGVGSSQRSSSATGRNQGDQTTRRVETSSPMSPLLPPHRPRRSSAGQIHDMLAAAARTAPGWGRTSNAVSPRTSGTPMKAASSTASTGFGMALGG